MNDDDIRTQLRRELDAAPAWHVDPQEAIGRAVRHHRRRMAVTVASVVVALGVTTASLVGLASFRHGAGTALGGSPPAGTGAGTSAPPSAQPSPPAAAAFTCDGRATTPADVTVAAGRDGVRIEVDNTSGEAMGFDYPLGGTNAPPGRHELEGPDGAHAWALGPGDYSVKCVPNAADRDTVPAATLRVVDPNGYWVSNELQCTSDERFEGNVDFAPGAGWASVDEAVHHALDGYAVPGDVIDRVGYPDEAGPEFVLVRDGRNIVHTDVFRIQGRWLYDGVQGCSGEDGVQGGFGAPIRRA